MLHVGSVQHDVEMSSARSAAAVWLAPFSDDKQPRHSNVAGVFVCGNRLWKAVTV
jgi:hypothetical protein